MWLKSRLSRGDPWLELVSKGLGTTKYKWLKTDPEKDGDGQV